MCYNPVQPTVDAIVHVPHRHPSTFFMYMYLSVLYPTPFQFLCRPILSFLLFLSLSLSFSLSLFLPYSHTQKGDLILVHKQNENGMWEGQINERHGHFPFKLVELVDSNRVCDWNHSTMWTIYIYFLISRRGWLCGGIALRQCHLHESSRFCFAPLIWPLECLNFLFRVNILAFVFFLFLLLFKLLDPFARTFRCFLNPPVKTPTC